MLFLKFLYIFIPHVSNTTYLKNCTILYTKNLNSEIKTNYCFVILIDNGFVFQKKLSLFLFIKSQKWFLCLLIKGKILLF